MLDVTSSLQHRQRLKKLCYHLPVLNTFPQNPDARALYLFPTRLSMDPEEGLRRLMTDAGLGPVITYDGDTLAMPDALPGAGR